jgi:signal transduction histidine kinase
MLIRGDPDMLKQAILNLVTNALDALKSDAMKGEAMKSDAMKREAIKSDAMKREAIKSDRGSLLLSVTPQGNTVVVEVADDGPGIPANVRDKVFQLYFTTKSRGSGIGLAMTYRAVQLHNGTIDFTSEDGRGTTFQLRFPAVAGHA